MLCLDVVQIICDFSDLRTQINLIQSCKEYDEYLKIRKLDCSWLVRFKIGFKITQEIIQQKKFNKLQKLNAGYNSKITNVNHLRNTLTELDCRWDCGIDQMGISDLLKLQKLNATNNVRITDVNHLRNTLTEYYIVIGIVE